VAIVFVVVQSQTNRSGGAARSEVAISFDVVQAGRVLVVHQYQLVVWSPQCSEMEDWSCDATSVVALASQVLVVAAAVESAWRDVPIPSHDCAAARLLEEAWIVANESAFADP